MGAAAALLLGAVLVVDAGARGGVVTAPSAPAVPAWRALGPAPIASASAPTGRAAGIATSARNAGRYYVAGAGGGVWRSTNAGRTWKATTDSMPILATGAITVDPTNDRVVYAGSGEANYAFHSVYGHGLYKSRNRGRTWEVLGGATFAGRTFSRLAVATTDPGIVYAAVARAGGTFRGREAAKGHPQAEGPRGLFRSLDGGETWEHLTRGLPSLAASDVAIDPDDASRVWAAIGEPFGHARNGIYRSLDGGETFTKLRGGLPGAGVGRISLAVAPSRPDRLYALVARRANRGSNGGFSPGGASTLGVFRSDDGGDSWVSRSAGNFQTSAGYYYNAAVVHPDDPDTFFVGGLPLLRSRDGGLSYDNVTPPHVDIHGLTFDAAGRLVVADDGGVHRSADLGNTWQSLNARLSIVQFYPGLSVHPTNPEIMIGGTQDNGTNLLQPGGQWLQVFGGDGGFTAIDPGAPRRVFVEFQGTANLFRSDDGGFTYVRSATGIDATDRNCFLPPFVFDPGDFRRLLYGTHRVYESTDGGASWTPISGDLTSGSPWAIRALVIAPSDSATVYAVTNDGRVQVSQDGGRTWFLSLRDLPGWPRVTREIAVDPEDPATAYLAVSRFGVNQVRVTRDHGRSWSSIDGDLPDVPVQAVAVHRAGEVRTVFVGTDAGVYMTTDEGAGWERFGRKLPNVPVHDLVVSAAHGRLVATTLGRGAFWIPLP